MTANRSVGVQAPGREVDAHCGNHRKHNSRRFALRLEIGPRRSSGCIHPTCTLDIKSHTQSRPHRRRSCAGREGEPRSSDRVCLHSPGPAAEGVCTRLGRRDRSPPRAGVEAKSTPSMSRSRTHSQNRRRSRYPRGLRRSWPRSRWYHRSRPLPRPGRRDRHLSGSRPRQRWPGCPDRDL